MDWRRRRLRAALRKNRQKIPKHQSRHSRKRAIQPGLGANPHDAAVPWQRNDRTGRSPIHYGTPLQVLPKQASVLRTARKRKKGRQGIWQAFIHAANRRSRLLGMNHPT